MPASSPTTTRAVNEKRRPPLTTLATRLISTTRSCRSRPELETERSGAAMESFEGSGQMVVAAAAAAGWIRPVDAGRRTVKRHSGRATGRFSGWRSGAAGRFQAVVGVVVTAISETQAALAGALGEGLDAAVVLVSAAVEDRGFDAGRLGALGQRLAGLLRLVERLEGAQVALRPADGGQRAAGVVVDELGEHAPVGAEHGDARAVGRAAHLGADAAAALEAPRGCGGDAHALFPTLRATYSPS